MSNSILNGEYKEAYTNIVLYLSSSNIPDDFSHEVSEDIEDLLINAQNDKRDVKDIIGNDIEAFCKEILKTKKFKGQVLFTVAKSIKWALLMSAIIALLYYLSNNQMTLNIIFMNMIDFLFCAFIFSRGLRKVLLKGKGDVKKIVRVMFLWILVSIPVAILNYIMLTNYVIEVDSLYTTIVLVAIMIVFHMMTKAMKKREIKILN